MSEFIPYARPALTEEAISAALDVLNSSWLSTGPKVGAFEASLCLHLSAKFSVVCSSATAALHMAMASLTIQSGDVVFVPGITFLSSANAARFLGADVYFVDVDSETGLMTAELLEQAILGCQKNKLYKSKKLKAVVNVHLNGQLADVKEISKVTRKYQLKLIEDAAHAIGSRYVYGETTRPVGANPYSDLTCFSFHAVKNLVCGEGGAVTTNDPELHKKLLQYRNHGVTRDTSEFKRSELAIDPISGEPNPWYYEMQFLGYNYRLSDILCALGIEQIKALNQLRQRRQQIVELYLDAFAEIENVSLVPKTQWCDPCWHLAVGRINYDALGKSRCQLMNALKSRGIGTQVHYIPVYAQPYYQALYGDIYLKGCEQYYDQALSFPLIPDLSNSETLQMIAVIKHELMTDINFPSK